MDELIMNILIVTPTYFPVRGGTEQVIHDVCDEFLKLGHNISILTVQNDKSWSLEEKIDGVEVFRFSKPNFVIDYPLYTLKAYRHTLRILKKKNFDLVVQYHVFPLGLGVALAARKAKLPLVTSLSGWDTYDPVFKIRKLYVRTMAWVMNNSDGLTSPSTQMAQIAQEVQGCKRDFQVIPHGTRLECLDSAFEGVIYKKFKAMGKKLIVSVQRLHERKGLRYLLDAIPQIIQEEPDVHFVICGKGPEEAALKKQAADLAIDKYISFEGFVLDEDLPQYYALADLFALPTTYEAFGLVYVDALTFGKPIVTCENAGAQDIINSSNGLVVPIRESKAFGNAVVRALRTTWNADEIKAGALQYRWPTIAAQYLEVYNKALGK